MKIRNLVILLVAAGVLGFWAYRIVDEGRQAHRPAQVGQAVFKDLPVNDVVSIVITTPETNFVIQRADEKWIIPARFNYPAKFDKVADTLVALRDLKIGQMVPGGSERLEAFNLQAPDSNVPTAATRLEVRGANNQLLAELLIGKHFNTQPPSSSRQPMMFGGGYPSGHYVRLADGAVAVIGRTLDNMIEPVKSWLADEFINVNASDLDAVEITGPERIPVKVRRNPDSKILELDGLQAEEGTADAGKLNQLAGALSYLSFDDVADPALSPAETGLDKPVVFTARASDGRIYTVHIGNPVSSDSADRYATARIEYVAPPTAEKKSEGDAAAGEEAADADEDKTELKEEARILNEKLSPWIYILRSYRVDNMLLERDALIATPEPEEQTEQPEAVSVDAETVSVANDQADVPMAQPEAEPADEPAENTASDQADESLESLAKPEEKLSEPVVEPPAEQ